MENVRRDALPAERAFVKRVGIKPGAKSLARGSTFDAKPKPRGHGDASRKRAFRRAARNQGQCMNPACTTPRADWNPHHVVYKQHVRWLGGDEWAPRNAMRLCWACHSNHHMKLDLPASVLPPAAVAFARELMGENAVDYLHRYYPEEN